MALIRCTCGCASSAEEHKMILCGICKNPYIHSCVDFTVSEIRTLHKKGSSWSCRNCHTLSSDIKELQAAILSLKTEIMARQPVSIDDHLFEELLLEMNERNDRKQNIILFNVEESDSRDINVRNDADRAATADILQSLPINIDIESVGIHRLGRHVLGAQRHRPLRVRLASTKDVHTIIKNAKHLRDSSDFKHVHIALDRTRRQMDYYKKIKLELDTRIANGESQLRIKYRRGIPVIDSLN